MSKLPLPARDSVLHLYRHLLREASYFPLFVRPHITDMIKTRFRGRRETESPNKLIQKAHHDLRYLRAASSGSLARLRQVLLIAFGRTGRRRRLLMNELVRPEPPVDSEALQQLVEAAAERSEKKDPWRKDWLAAMDTNKLKRYIKSQAAQGLTNTPTPLISSNQMKFETAKVPDETAWGRPLSDRAVRGKVRKAWKMMLKRIQPPLPLGEWELLRDAASGKRPIEEWGMPKRRTVARAATNQTSSIAQDTERSWGPYATKAIRYVESDRSRRLRAMSGAEDTTSPILRSPLDNNSYTPRLLRRLYHEIWCMTSAIEKDASGKGWVINWGRRGVDVPVATTLEFFEDLNGVKADSTPQNTSKRASKRSSKTS